MTTHPELAAPPAWGRTGSGPFPVAALVDGCWWVLRLNAFPDHPLWTLFVDGRVRRDIDDMPPTWGRPLDPAMPRLDDEAAVVALGPVLDFVAYGSEVGQPCDNPFCCG